MTDSMPQTLGYRSQARQQSANAQMSSSLPPLRSQNSAKMQQKKKKQQQAAPSTETTKREPLVLGNFTVSPSTATVPKGASTKINVDFNAEYSNSSIEVVVSRKKHLPLQVIGIDIFDRDPQDHPEGIPFDLIGEVCVPGIDTEDFMSIFEEQVVYKSLSCAPSSSLSR